MKVIRIPVFQRWRSPVCEDSNIFQPQVFPILCNTTLAQGLPGGSRMPQNLSKKQLRLSQLMLVSQRARLSRSLDDHEMQPEGESSRRLRKPQFRQRNSNAGEKVNANVDAVTTLGIGSGKLHITLYSMLLGGASGVSVDDLQPQVIKAKN